MNETAKVPWHLWVVGGLTLLWNAVGCYIYTMTMLRDPSVMTDVNEEVRAVIENAPAWSNAGWALGVWGALFGSILLLLRNGMAVWAFIISLAGLATTAVYEASVSMPMEIGQVALIWGIALFLLWYAWTMRGRGVLR